MEQVKYNGKEIDIILISSIGTPAFERLISILSETSVVGLDAEWRPQKTSKPKASEVGLDVEGKSDETRQSEFPQVCVLQIACLPKTSRPVVFLLDLWQLQSHPPSIPKIHEQLRKMFKSRSIVKLGYGFKRDIQYISYTFQSHFKFQGFDQVDLYLDIFDIYNKILSMRQITPAKQRKKLTVICEEILGNPLSKEHQQKDWSERPLKKELMEYAAIDAYCLIEILDVYWREVLSKGGMSYDVAEPGLPLSESSMNTIPKDDLLQIVTDCKGKFSGTIEQPRSRINNGGQSFAQPISRRPWDCSLGGDGRPKFLCGDMMEGLCKLLRVDGIDTKIANKADRILGYESSSTADLIQQAEEEGRVLLTTDKHGKHALNYYKLKSGLKKEDQLDEVFKAFGLEKSKDQISRCTKCNTEIKLLCSPLTPTSKAIEATEGDNPLCWCGNCRDRYARDLYVDDKRKYRLDYDMLAKVGRF